MSLEDAGYQRTLKNTCALEGIGVHSGLRARVVFGPAGEDAGFRFRRSDTGGDFLSAHDTAEWQAPGAESRSTVLGRGTRGVETVEHCLAAAYALGLTNLNIEIDGPEMPLLDGGAAAYLNSFEEAGLQKQTRLRKRIAPREPVFVTHPQKAIAIFPDNRLRITYTLDYPGSGIPSETFSSEITLEVFRRDIAPAKTFCREEEWKSLQAAGYGKGATLENSTVLENDGRYRGRTTFEDEGVRHKVLDLIGDMALSGCQIIGHVIAIRSGHSLNREFVKKLIA